MAVATGTAILGAGLASGIGGAIAGGSDKTSTSGGYVPPATGQELQLREQSFQNYLQQQQIQNQMEQGIAGGQPVQDVARDRLQSIMGGQAFDVDPATQARIAAARDATIQAGQADINKFLTEGMSGIMGNAANRGLRGQALSELQGRQLGAATDQYGRLVSGANVTAANQALNLPMQYAQIQGGLANSNANFAENLRQQAFANRQQLQNPALMQAMQRDRLGAATQTTTEQGSVGGAIGGALGGLGAGMSGGANIGYALNGAGGGQTNGWQGGGPDYSTMNIPSSSQFRMS